MTSSNMVVTHGDSALRLVSYIPKNGPFTESPELNGPQD
jgi:hypothetical protein